MGKAQEGKVEQGEDECCLLFPRGNPKLLSPLALQVNKMNTP